MNGHLHIFELITEYFIQFQKYVYVSWHSVLWFLKEIIYVVGIIYLLINIKDIERLTGIIEPFHCIKNY